MAEVNPCASDIFAEAIKQESVEERGAFVVRACGDNAELRREIESLLKAHDEIVKWTPFIGLGNLANSPQPVVEATIAPTSRTGAQLRPNPPVASESLVAGRYKLLQQIGEGGMGSVWMAEQTAPVKRRVAVKLIRTERGNSKMILARFGSWPASKPSGKPLR
jgi:hypothetical protein